MSMREATRLTFSANGIDSLAGTAGCPAMAPASGWRSRRSPMLAT